jgi:hypothetical protein
MHIEGDNDCVLDEDLDQGFCYEDLDEDLNNTINSPNNYISVDEFMMQEILLNSFTSNNANN